MPDEFHEWRVDAGAPAIFCEMSMCGRAAAYRAIYTFQHEGMLIPEVRTWAVCAFHAKVWGMEKQVSLPVELVWEG